MNNIEETRTLNPYQKEAVLDENPACLVNANVGSGKTTVLIEKVRYLHEKKQIPYEKMAVLTFTNKAAQEMRERVDALVGYGSEDIWISTFHATCSRILRRHIDLLGYDRNFTIYDASDQMSLKKEVLK